MSTNQRIASYLWATVLCTGVCMMGQAPPKDAKKKPAPPAAKDKKPSTTPKKPAIVNPLVIKVETTTGKGNKYADSKSARVYILLNGDEQHKHRLRPPGKNGFERGVKNEFTIKVDFDPEKIEFIRLQNESMDMWKCDAISFQFAKAGLESSVVRHKPAQYLSSGKERKFAGSSKHLDFKMQVKLKPPVKAETPPI